jgi:murein tripeptide amidase MpaA
MVEGLIDFLCGPSFMAEFMRKNAIFKIIPMLNPDGVILGNYRTGLFGKDFNREFHCPDKDIFPEIYSLK